MRTESQRQLLLDWATALEDLDGINWAWAGFDMCCLWATAPPKSPMLGCGTVCCAYGVGTALPSWRKSGVKLKYDGEEYKPSPSARNRLGLTDDQFNWVTQPGRYPDPWNVSPGDVAARVRSLCCPL